VAAVITGRVLPIRPTVSADFPAKQVNDYIAQFVHIRGNVAVTPGTWNMSSTKLNRALACVAAGAAPALLVGLVSAAPAAGAPVPSPGQLAGQHPAVSGWSIRTVAGGIGGPTRARSVSLSRPCGVTWSGTSLLVGTGAESGYVGRAVNTGTGRLTNLAGIGLAGRLPSTARR
jgi:hypothetical protein